MILTYFGEGGFRLQSGDLSLLVDPPNNRLKGDVVLRTSFSADIKDFDQSDVVYAGEYEVKGIEILGWQVISESNEKKVKNVFLVRWDGMQFAFLGQITNPLETQIIENFDGDIDILFLPIGGGNTLSAKDAADTAKKLEPAVVVPSFFKNPSEFLKLMDQNVKPVEKLVFKKKDLDGKKEEVLILKGGDN